MKKKSRVRKPRQILLYQRSFRAAYTTDNGWTREACIGANVISDPKMARRYAKFFLEFADWAEEAKRG
jgi:hypothetical protein